MISDRLKPIFIPAVEHWVTTVDVHWTLLFVLNIWSTNYLCTQYN